MELAGEWSASPCFSFTGVPLQVEKSEESFLGNDSKSIGLLVNLVNCGRKPKVQDWKAVIKNMLMLMLPKPSVSE